LEIYSLIVVVLGKRHKKTPKAVREEKALDV
jgi:hypothetical protein